MTPEDINRTIEFLIQHAARFSAQMDELRLRQEDFARRHEDFARRHEHDHKFLVDLTQQTARFESWAAEVMAIESRRLDEHDRLQQDAKAFQNEALRLLHRILDRLPPARQ
jgi:O-methyltransferase involved in polyketide biosynthesis